LNDHLRKVSDSGRRTSRNTSKKHMYSNICNIRVLQQRCVIERHSLKRKHHSASSCNRHEYYTLPISLWPLISFSFLNLFTSNLFDLRFYQYLIDSILIWSNSASIGIFRIRVWHLYVCTFYSHFKMDFENDLYIL